MADGSAVPSGAAAGLVTSPTSRTRFRRLRTITQDEAHRRRLRKVRQNVLTTARLHAEDAMRGGFRGRWAMLTLTFRDEERWCAKQISAFIDCLRKYAERSGFKARYTWVLELTKRGRPHYHVLIWLPKGRTLPKPDKRGWWTCGSTRIEWARNAVGYLAKYASKGIERELMWAIPTGARLSGFGGLSREARIELRWWKCPRWLREVWSEICDVGRVQGGGYVNRETGEFLASPYSVVFEGGVLVLYEVER